MTNFAAVARQLIEAGGPGFSESFETARSKRVAKEESDAQAQRDQQKEQRRQELIAATAPWAANHHFLSGKLMDENGDGILDDTTVAARAIENSKRQLSRPGLSPTEKLAHEKFIKLLERGDYNEIVSVAAEAQRGFDALAGTEFEMSEFQSLSTKGRQDAMAQRRADQQLDISQQNADTSQANSEATAMNAETSAARLDLDRDKFEATQGRGITIPKGTVLIDPNTQEILFDNREQQPTQQPFSPEVASLELPATLQGQDIIALSTGAENSVRGALENNTFTSGSVDGEMQVAARNVMGNFVKQAESALVNNPRVPVSEIEQIRRLGLTDLQGSFFQSATGTENKILSTMTLLKSQLDIETRLANDPNATTRVRGDAQASAQQIASALSLGMSILQSSQTARPGESTAPKVVKVTRVR